MAGQSPRRLTRGHDRMLGGVCGGIAEYFDLDPTIVRIAFVLLVLLTAGAGGLLIYFVLWLVMPAPTGEAPVSTGGSEARQGPDGALVLGVVLLIFGSLLLLQRMPYFDWFHLGMLRFSWPAALIFLGLLLVFAARRR